MKQSFVQDSLFTFTQKLASKDAVPGGGGAAALCGALAACLNAMVGNLTVGKKKYAENEPEVLEILDHMAQSRLHFLALLEEDAKVFLPLSKAYGMPKNTPEEQAEKEKVMEEALFLAAQVPLSILEEAGKLLPHARRLVEIGSLIAVSDVGVSVSLAVASARGAALNVYCNTCSMKDRDMANALNVKTAELLEQIVKEGSTIYLMVEKKLIP